MSERKAVIKNADMSEVCAPLDSFSGRGTTPAVFGNRPLIFVSAVSYLSAWLAPAYEEIQHCPDTGAHTFSLGYAAGCGWLRDPGERKTRGSHVFLAVLVFLPGSPGYRHEISFVTRFRSLTSNCAIFNEPRLYHRGPDAAALHALFVEHS